MEAASEDFTGAVELLIRRGAALHDVVGGQRVSDAISEKFGPDFDPRAVAREPVSTGQRDADILGAMFGHLK